jgi:hypothetical protein
LKGRPPTSVLYSSTIASKLGTGASRVYVIDCPCRLLEIILLWLVCLPKFGVIFDEMNNHAQYISVPSSNDFPPVTVIINFDNENINSVSRKRERGRKEGKKKGSGKDRLFCRI